MFHRFKHVAVALVALSCAIGTAVSGQKEPAMATINLDQQDNGRTVTVAPQTTIVLSLPENPSTGYSWQLQPFTGPALAVTADSFTPSTSELRPGAGGTRTITILAEAPGMETVVLRLQRPWEKTMPPVETLAVTITVAAAADTGR